MLGLSLHGWENAMVIFLIVAGFFALIAGAATWAVVRLQRIELAKSQKELNEYKLTVEEKVAEAKTKGIEAGKMAGDALLRAAALEKEAAELKAANLALEAQVQPRRLSGDNSAKLSAALAKMQPLPIAIVSRLFDPEGADFADDLSNAFDKARWQAVRQKDWTMSNRGAALATLEGTSIPPDVATALLAALEAASVKASVTTIPVAQQNTTSAHFQPNALYLLVGAKP